MQFQPVSFFVPDFLETQDKSFQSFIDKGINEEFSRILPILEKEPVDKNLELTFFPKKLHLISPDFKPTEAVLKRENYTAVLHVLAQLKNNLTQDSFLGWVGICDLPIMTKRGHFIVNGSCRVVVNQLIRSPGFYCKEDVFQDGPSRYYGDLIPHRGAWLRIVIDRNSNIWLRLKNMPRVSALLFLRLLLFSEKTLYRDVLFYERYREASEHFPTGSKKLYVTSYPYWFEEKEFKKELKKQFKKLWPLKRQFKKLFLKRVKSVNADKIVNLLEKKGNNVFKKTCYKLMNPETYTLGKVGRGRLNGKLGILEEEKKEILTSKDFVYLIAYLIKVKHNRLPVDDIDNLKNRRVRPSGELIQNAFYFGLVRFKEFVQKKFEKPLKVLRFNQDTLNSFIKTEPINMSLRQFFGTNPLLQYMDQTNPLAEITHKRRISTLGIGGITRDTAGMGIRGIHPTYYGRICPIETPEGKNAGLVSSLTTFSKTNSTGFLKTPFYKIYKGQALTRKKPVYLSAAQEEGGTIAPPDLVLTKLNFLCPVLVPTRTYDIYKRVAKNSVNYLGISAIQMISVATSLIPFLEHDDANRALMGSNMQRQAVSPLSTELPIVGTGLEFKVVVDSGNLLQAKKSGYVESASGKSITLKQSLSVSKISKASYGKGSEVGNISWNSQKLLGRNKTTQNKNLLFLKKQENKKLFKSFVTWYDTKPSQTGLSKYTLTSFNRSNQGTCLIAKPAVKEGQWVQKGEPLTDCAASVSGELALGKNLIVAYMPWEGYNFEDAILISKRLQSENLFSSIHIERYNTQTIKTKYGLEQITDPFMSIKLNRDYKKKKNKKEQKKKVRYKIFKNYNKRVLDRETPCDIHSTKKDLMAFQGFIKNKTQLPFKVCKTRRDYKTLNKIFEKQKFAGTLLGKSVRKKNQIVVPEKSYPFNRVFPKSSGIQKFLRLNIKYRKLRRINAKTYHITETSSSRNTKPTSDSKIILSSINLGRNGIVQEGSWVQEGDVLVGKVTPIPANQSGVVKFIRAVTKTKTPTLRDTSLRVPKDVEGRVIGIYFLDPKKPRFGTESESRLSINCLNLKSSDLDSVRVQIHIAEKKIIQVGDKMSGRHGNKGIVSRILPSQDMPFLPNGQAVDVVLNPLGIPSRMNVGQVFESLLGLAGIHLNQKLVVPPFDESKGSEISRSLTFYKLYIARLKTGENWLFNPEFPGKTKLFDGREGDSFDQLVTVGGAYILKLIHLVDDKIHARSTGPYSLITQQPLAGRSKQGGQRVGEMEVWAIEGFGAAYTLQELLTVKSDDLSARRQVSSNLSKHQYFSVRFPEAFTVVVRELQSLCLNIKVSTGNFDPDLDFIRSIA